MGIEGGEVTGEEPSAIVVVEEVEEKYLVKRGDFWLYFMVYFLGGLWMGLVYLNNLGQIAESRGFSNGSLQVSLSSSLEFFGRLLRSLYDYFFSM
nr:protein NUCLEAR FUSION DEFECTIVE 4-like [Ipomoea trifida]